MQLQEAIFQRGYTGGFSGAIVLQTGGVVVTNLYANPQEDTTIGIRHLPMGVLLGAEAQRYSGVLEKFPITIKVGFTEN